MFPRGVRLIAGGSYDIGRNSEPTVLRVDENMLIRSCFSCSSVLPQMPGTIGDNIQAEEKICYRVCNNAIPKITRSYH